MAWLTIYGAHTINGVAELHTKLLKKEVLTDWFSVYPDKFKNITNGITHRSWLAFSNPELSALITDLIGNNEWLINLDKLKALEKYKDNKEVLNMFLEVKQKKKNQLALYISENEGIEINPESIFDIQIKRLHEYKRQLLNAFYILYLYHKLKDDPELDFVPRTFIFGAKAAPGYKRAKAIIKFINDISILINSDEKINSKIKVVFIKNYNVSYAEKLFPAADVSEQISTAGKEASGTGNMKFMLNGAPTLGTLDGANIEIVEASGADNNFIFGARVEELKEIKDSYNPKDFYLKIPGLKKVVNTLIDNTFGNEKNKDFYELYRSLLLGEDWHKPDNYYVLKDFNSYVEAQERIDTAYRDRLGWAKKCWINLCNAGHFSSGRAVNEYAEHIWNIKPAITK